ncbi:hypothetical protein ACQZV8_17950 [Magnetococcales bacterium HHB-1]
MTVFSPFKYIHRHALFILLSMLMLLSSAPAWGEARSLRQQQEQFLMISREVDRLTELVERFKRDKADMENQALEAEQNNFLLEQKRNDAWKKLAAKTKKMWEDPSISLDEERRTYRDVLELYKKNYQEYAKLIKQVPQFKRAIQETQQKLSLEKKRLDEQQQKVRQAYMAEIETTLQQELRVEASGESQCAKTDMIQSCQKRALQIARNRAAEQWVKRMRNSLPSLEGNKIVSLPKLHVDNALVLEHQVLADGWSDRLNYFFKIQAVVRGRMNQSLLSQHGRLTITPYPAEAKVRILNIQEAYRPGIALPPGRYHVDVSLAGYNRLRQWITMGKSDLSIPLELFSVNAANNNQGGKYALYINPTPAEARIRILNIRPRYQHGMRLGAGNYHVEVSHPGFQVLRQWVKLSDRDVTIPVKLASLRP